MHLPCLASPFEQACHQGGLQRVCAHEAGGGAVSRTQSLYAYSCLCDATSCHQHFYIFPIPKRPVVWHHLLYYTLPSIQCMNRSPLPFLLTVYRDTCSQHMNICHIFASLLASKFYLFFLWMPKAESVNKSSQIRFQLLNWNDTILMSLGLRTFLFYPLHVNLSQPPVTSKFDQTFWLINVHQVLLHTNESGPDD